MRDGGARKPRYMTISQVQQYLDRRVGRRVAGYDEAYVIRRSEITEYFKPALADSSGQTLDESTGPVILAISGTTAFLVSESHDYNYRMEAVKVISPTGIRVLNRNYPEDHVLLVAGTLRNENTIESRGGSLAGGPTLPFYELRSQPLFQGLRGEARKCRVFTGHTTNTLSMSKYANAEADSRAASEATSVTVANTNPVVYNAPRVTHDTDFTLCQDLLENYFQSGAEEGFTGDLISQVMSDAPAFEFDLTDDPLTTYTSTVLDDVASKRPLRSLTSGRPASAITLNIAVYGHILDYDNTLPTSYSLDSDFLGVVWAVAYFHTDIGVFVKKVRFPGTFSVVEGSTPSLQSARAQVATLSLQPGDMIAPETIIHDGEVGHYGQDGTAGGIHRCWEAREYHGEPISHVSIRIVPYGMALHPGAVDGGYRFVMLHQMRPPGTTIGEGSPVAGNGINCSSTLGQNCVQLTATPFGSSVDLIAMADGFAYTQKAYASGSVRHNVPFQSAFSARIVTYTIGRAAHSSEIAAEPPICLSELEDIVLKNHVEFA